VEGPTVHQDGYRPSGSGNKHMYWYSWRDQLSTKMGTDPVVVGPVGPSTSTSTCVCYHYHWVGTRLGGQLVPPRVPVQFVSYHYQLVPPRVPVHVFVTKQAHVLVLVEGPTVRQDGYRPSGSGNKHMYWYSWRDQLSTKMGTDSVVVITNTCTGTGGGTNCPPRRVPTQW
jgi:hypothetical protein